MHVLAIPALIMAGITFYVGLYHLFIYFRRKFICRSDLTFAVTCFSMGLYAIFCAGLYNSSSLAEGIHWQRAQVATLTLIGAAFIWFIVDYTSLKSKRIRNFFTVYFSIATLISLLDPTTLSFQIAKPAVKSVILPFHLSIIYYEVKPGPLTDFNSIIGILVFVYIFKIGLEIFKAGNKTKAKPLLWSVLFFCIGLCNDVAVHIGLYSFIYTIEYSYMAIVLMMAYSLSVAIVESAIMKEAVQKSYEKLAETSQLLAGSSHQVNEATADIDSAMYEVTDGTQSQNKHIQATRQTLGHLLTNIENISREAKRGTMNAAETTRKITSGIDAMKYTFDSMQGIEKSVDNMWQITKGFASHSEKIDTIVEVINDIASRVHVLSLNASIEATKAGAYGSGFMVIAKQIRLLAENTKISTDEILNIINAFQKDIHKVEEVIKEGLDRVNKSTQLTNTGKNTLDSIRSLVDEELDRLERITEQILEIKDFSEQVEEEMNSVASVSERTTATVETVHTSTKEMSTMMTDLASLAENLGKMATEKPAHSSAESA
jgi:methyl-accepting chemotaxis protein